MRINWLLPFIAKTGGIVVVLEHARGLRALGHDVVLYYPLLPYREFLVEERSLVRKWILGQAKPLLGNLVRYRRSIPWSPFPMPVVPVPALRGAFIRDADATLATAWPTAYSAAALPASKGRKFYFVQHYETWSSDPTLVDGSYRLPLEILTIAPWLTNLMRDRFSRPPRAEIHNGIDLDRFRPPAAREWSRPSLLMMHHELTWKGVPDGLEVLARAHARYPGIPIRMFGMHPFPGKPPWIEYHRDPSPDVLVDLYRGATIFLSPSHKEGWHLPPMEAMACGCAVVATEVGCIPVLRREGNILTVPPRDREGLWRSVERLLADPDLCREVAGRGRETISAFTWDAATRKLADALSA